jgi:hypothetical protein
MGAPSAFRDDELITRRQKINGEWVESQFPRVGGRLRLAHENNGTLSIQSEVVRLEETYAVVKATATTDKGSFCGYGTASAQRDQRLADSLLELAETRSIARALRFAGFGVEYTGAEEVSHVIPEEPERERTVSKPPIQAVPDAESSCKPETKPSTRTTNAATVNNGRATQAQCRALHALVRKAKYTDEDLAGMLSPLNASRFEDLTVSDASRLIQYLQTEVAA